MAFYRVRVDIIVDAHDQQAASDDASQWLDSMPEPDPPILAVYQASDVDLVHRAPGDSWVVVAREDEPGMPNQA